VKGANISQLFERRSILFDE